MTITVAKLKRALEETASDASQEGCVSAQEALLLVAYNPHSLTILAEKLSERPARVTPEAQRRTRPIPGGHL